MRRGVKTYVIKGLYRWVTKTIADILLDQQLMIEQIIGHQWLIMSDVLLFYRGQSYGLYQCRVCHQISLVVHNETSHTILSTHPSNLIEHKPMIIS